LKRFSESEMEVVDTSMLKELSVADPRKRVKIVADLARYAREKHLIRCFVTFLYEASVTIQHI
jgi:hypothetical protein